MIISDKARDAAELVLGVGALTGLLPAVALGLGWAMFGEAFFEVMGLVAMVAIGTMALLLLWSCADDLKAGRL